MSFDVNEKQWKCGKGGAVNLQRVGSIVRDIGEPCLRQSPIKVVIAISKMLKPDKWQATFASDGKILGFQKVLKLIILGGVDPSIRAEVWEFLLGCYTLSSTAEYRRQLRTARRERYRDLIKQCQTMHSSVGTGSLAYVVGSKVMDMRSSSTDNRGKESDVRSGRASDTNANESDNHRHCYDNGTDSSYSCQRESSMGSGDLVRVGGSTNGTAYNSSCHLPTSGPYRWNSTKSESEVHGSRNLAEDSFDFPPLPVTDLFEKNKKHKKIRRSKTHDDRLSTRRKLSLGDEHMHSFQICNNSDLLVESNSSIFNDVSLPLTSEDELAHLDKHESARRPNNGECETDMLNGLRISDAPEMPGLHASTSQGVVVNEERVSEWLWTLHQIVVDVVRTDSHLEFYEDTRNLARMSDILAVYAWVDPATGYCQGMSDLLSPFVVLFEDNADAFWCFEMLLRRMHENFQIEGPTGVMKQLQALWHILELTDKEMFAHLSRIGAESLHFAFRMLLVLFRRELSFNEALRMWEMIWAADFDESMACQLEESCPQLIQIQIPRKSGADSGRDSNENHKDGFNGGLQSKNAIMENSITGNCGMRSTLPRPLCGLTKNFWSKHDHTQTCTVMASTKNGDDELPVFCVAAILFMNRQKIIKETHSIDDLIKIFNDRMLKIRVKRCVRTAIKLRKKYFYKPPGFFYLRSSWWMSTTNVMSMTVFVFHPPKADQVQESRSSEY